MKRAYIYGAIALIFLLFTLFLSVQQTQQPQPSLTPKAQVPAQASLELFPASAEIVQGSTLDVEVRLTVLGDPISGLTMRLIMPKGSNELEPVSLAFNPTLLSSGAWSVPIQRIIDTGSEYQIELSAIDTTIDGFPPTSGLLVATIQLQANAAVAPRLMQFDMVETKILRKSDAANILNFATGGSYEAVLPQAGLQFSVNFEAISTSATSVPVRLIVRNMNTSPIYLHSDQSVTLTRQVDGTYQSPLLQLSGDPEARNDYDILVKGPSHLQRAFSGYRIARGEDQNHSLLSKVLWVGDVNGDNNLTIADISLILVLYTDFSIPVSPGTPEDVNLDGIISIEDIALALIHYTDFTIPGEE